MNPQSTPRTTLTRVTTALLVAGALHSATANAASFQYRHPIMGMIASPTSQAQQVATEILVALTGGPTLPAGEVNWPYSYDLKQLLSVTGDSNYNASNVSWELQSGALPAGLSLGTDGVLSGIPTTKDTVGSSFQVKATYKTKTGQQAYTIVVNGAILRVTQISAGMAHACAVTTTSEVKCWGFNNSGQLGNNSTVNSAVPVTVSGLVGVTSISAGSYHTCALTSTGGVKCWGSGSAGQLGSASISSYVPVEVTGLTSGVSMLAAGHGHNCALVSGAVKCWGSNNYGQLGNNSTTVSSTPVTPVGLTSGVAKIGLGSNHSCAITTEGAALCWGQNSNGKLGNGRTTDSHVPVAVSGMTSGVASIAGGYMNTCAITTSGAAKCWGHGGYYQLGNGGSSDSSTPKDVSGLSSGVVSLAMPGLNSFHICALTATGAVLCWGYNSNGQLGDGSTSTRSVPTAVSGLSSGVTSLAAGDRYTCATLSSGGTKCWGYNYYGQLGNGSTTDTKVPVAVTP